VTEFLPAQSADEEEADPELEPELPALLSLPQAVSISAVAAVSESVVPSVLPMRLSFTYFTFGCRTSDSPATYAAPMDGSRMKGEREVNRLSDFTA
jgi:hypothetical protein